MLTPSSARKAESLGYTNVKQFVDGMPEWKKNGLPVASTVVNLKDLINKDIPHVLIDIRQSDVAEKEHIPGAINIPIGDLEKSKDRFSIKKSAPIIIYSDRKEDSLKAFNIIRKWGFMNTSYLEGGMDEWKKTGGMVVAKQLKKEIVYVPKPKPGEITPEEFKKLMADPSRKKIIIDVREYEETQEGMLSGAINIPVNEIKERLKEIPKDRETIVVVHCGTGVRAEMAYNLLKEEGYDNVRFLNANVKINKDGTYEISKEEE